MTIVQKRLSRTVEVSLQTVVSRSTQIQKSHHGWPSTVPTPDQASLPTNEGEAADTYKVYITQKVL